MTWIYDDGGRAAAGFKGKTGDCGARAVAIAAEIPYREAVGLIDEAAKAERPRGKATRSSASSGVWPKTLGRVLAAHGFRWVSTMGIGTGCRVHLRADELPAGRLVVRVSKHFCAVIDGVIHDTSDDSRDGSRCVYGYWVK